MSSELPQHPYAWIAGLMSSFPRPWALCGGWAVDAWLGRKTRRHGDVDITVFIDHQRSIFEHLAAFHLIAHDPNVYGATTDPWTGRTLDLPAHIHARERRDGSLEVLHNYVTGVADPMDDKNLEVLFNEQTAGDWVLDHDASVTLPLDLAFAPSSVGLPAVVPVVLLYFKSLDRVRKRDTADFHALLPTLPAGDRAWLRDVIAAAQPDHPWLSGLAE